MVTFAQLRSAKPASWIAAADDLLAAAQHCERVKDDVHGNGVRSLNEDWQSQYGQSAAVHALLTVADQAEIAAILARSTVDPLDSLGRAIEIAQQELESGLEIARKACLEVDPATGAVTIPAALRHEEGAIHDRQRAQQVIDNAIKAATQADGHCTEALAAAAQLDPAKTSSSVADAQNIQARNAELALEEIRNTLPEGLPPDLVEQWWNALTPAERSRLELAAPIELFDLPGIPDGVKRELDRPENGFSAIGALRYARAHVDDTGIDWTGRDNCTNFVSHVLAYGGGMSGKESWWKPRRFDDDGWSDGTGGGSDIGPPGWAHTPSWGAAQENRDFFVENGGRIVASVEGSAGTLAGVRPGDLLYFTETQERPAGEDHGALHPGQVHHAAVVTAVLPDGNVLYTQHSGAAENYPLNGRLPEFEQQVGRQKIEVVRPKVTW
ncbi:amidase [Nocardia panacis]|uniref:Amidase n=1 Tax=Nocardia panacis TaxID=2340916 RepID=A0A3A4KKF1_9NOCA|nr:amidase domain-containing protein [Nocardia panacis]RJO77134.1 amidase [Nocardia panacis]